MGFSQLHNHSRFSLFDGLVTPEKMVERAADLGFSALGLTDHGSISGLIAFNKSCRQYGIKPVSGAELYWCDDVEQKDRLYHMCLFPKNMNGWKHLCSLMSYAYQHKYRKPRFDLKALYGAKDIVCSTACAVGALSHINYQRVVDILYDIFRDDLYLEIMPLRLDEQDVVNQRALLLHKEKKLNVIATNDIHYLDPAGAKSHAFLLKSKTGGRFEFEVEGLFMRTEGEMKEAFKKNCPYLPSKFVNYALGHTQELVDKIDFYLEKREISLPSVLEGDPDKNLKELAEAAFKRIHIPSGQTKVYKERLKYELSSIQTKKFSNYFLMVWDVIEFCKKTNIPVGPGRGSAAGSFVCYLLGITQLDPIKEGLLFERFLAPDRSDYPDIDVDFSRELRMEVFKYLQGRYGEDRVAFINTFAEAHPKTAFKDVCRENGVAAELANAVTTLFQGYPTVKEEINESVEIQGLVRSIPNIDNLVGLSDGICGVFRQTGTHAAGFVVSSEPVKELAVVEEKDDGPCVTWQMDEVSYLGWVKFDVLGLRTLDIIQTAYDLIKERHGEIRSWDDRYDQEYLLEFGMGHTVGMFQFESSTVSNLCKALHPITKKETLVDINALVRPGPLDSGMTELYRLRYCMALRGKKYLDFSTPYKKWTDPITKDTFGVVVYQEQIMAIARQVAGFTPTESDNLRKLIAKSKGALELEKVREDFISGCEKHGKMPNETADILFNAITNYGRYAFNKSHSAAYTELAIRQMWLKKNYPVEYMASLFIWTSEADKRAAFRSECDRLGISVNLPDINVSEKRISIVGSELIVGLEDIKDVGASAVETILEQRRHGRFEDILDFRLRCPKSKVNKRVLTALITVGAFDNYHLNKKVAVENIDWLGKLTPARASKCTIDFYKREEDYEESYLSAQRFELLPGVFSMGKTLKLGTDALICGEELSKLRQEIGRCRKCSLGHVYDCPVAFEYHDNPSIFVIGEAPGAEELEEGRPFIGGAGQLMMEGFSLAGFGREDLYISNIFKCRPFKNRLPADPPIDCYDFIRREIELLNPNFVMAFGGTVMRAITGNKTGIRALSGTVTLEKFGNWFGQVLWSVHPAAVMRNGIGDKERMKKAFELLKERAR